MKTIVVISDTHRNTAPLDKISVVLSECDYIFHLGDMTSDAKEIMRAYKKRHMFWQATTTCSAAKARSY